MAYQERDTEPASKTEDVSRERQSAVHHVARMKEDYAQTERNLMLLREGVEKALANEHITFERLQQHRPEENQTPQVNVTGNWTVKQ